ncbi:uncharacterized protein [Rutidosis leptorrhynchoides]|uniref:uncharacterized protein n=1 Tax=Rutidosis leptorrhynchoides TaxID=125765 RepID=UPI003A994E01
MEHQWFRALLYLRLGFILSLLARIGYCKHTSSSFSELGNHRYVTEEYFQKYDTLIDHVFQDFISDEVSHSSNKNQTFVPKLSILQRQLIGEGSHRRLTSSIRIEINPEALSKLYFHLCKSIIIERLPSGVFADPFELQHLTERGVFSDASVFGDTDLELPTVRANRSVVEAHMALDPSTKNVWDLNFEIPLHIRYPPLGNDGYTRVEFGSPDLLLYCNIERDSSYQSLIFSSTNDGVGSSFDAIVWDVPSGIVKHTKFVSVVTFISAVIGAFAILMACVFYSDVSVYNGSKES